MQSPMEGFTCVERANVLKCNLQSVYRIKITHCTTKLTVVVTSG